MKMPLGDAPKWFWGKEVLHKMLSWQLSSLQTPKATLVTEYITVTILDVHRSQEIKNAGSHSNQDAACQERRNVLA